MCCIFVFGCSVYKNINDTLTNSIQPFVNNTTLVITNDVKPVLSNLNVFTGESVSVMTNVNSILTNVNIAVIELHGVMTNVNDGITEAKTTIKSLNKLAINANILINKLNHTQEDIKDFVPKWVDRSRLILEILLGILAIYAFRRNKIDDDIRGVYNKSKMRMSSFFK